MDLQKIPFTISSPASENLLRLQALFPSIVKDGQVDFDALKAELGEFEEVGKERYELSWAGKQEAKRTAGVPVIGRTLKYVQKESKDPDSTENLYIEGDNLEVLKLLQNAYIGKIKMIYIDPPYNTGKDFVYNDHFAVTAEENAKAEGDVSAEGERYAVNPDTSAKYHANWLTMMYPRLRLAKNLLSDDGVIFISISDIEVGNLREICDEIFGPDNYVNIISVNMKNVAGASGGGEDKRLKKNCEFVLLYAKNYQMMPKFSGVYEYSEMFSVVEKYRVEGKTWHYTSVLVDPGDKIYVGSTLDGNGGEIKIYRRPHAVLKSINQIMKDEGIAEKDVYYKYGTDIFEAKDAQSSIRGRVINAKKDMGIVDDVVSIEYIPKTGKNKGIVYEQYYKGEKCRLFAWLRDISEVIDGVLYKKELQGTYLDFTQYINNLSKEGDVVFPNGKKPISLIRTMIELQNSSDAIVLDFFSGSSTTAHAVMQLNAEDGGNRKFIMVQLLEDCPPNSELFRAGYKTICDVGKERIRRAGEMIRKEHPDAKIDTGFKVFKTDTTAIKWIAKEAGIKIPSPQSTLITTKTSANDQRDFMPGVTDLDVVYEILLRQHNIPLSAKTENLINIGKRTYCFADVVVVCLEEKITDEIIDMIASIEPAPHRVIFRDSAFGRDISLKINAMERFDAMIEKRGDTNKKIDIIEFL